MAKFAYNNAQNASTGHISFELNCCYYLYIFFDKKIDPHSQLKTVDELSTEL